MKGLICAVALATVIGSGLPASAGDIKELVNSVADEAGVPRNIAHAIVIVESRYNCRARNQSSGASGIMQVLPATARSMGIRGNLFDCRVGLIAGMRYLKEAIDRGGIGCAGVSLYERGIAARMRCTAYGRKVIAEASRQPAVIGWR